MVGIKKLGIVTLLILALMMMCVPAFATEVMETRELKICLDNYSETKNDGMLVVGEENYFALRDILALFPLTISWTNEEAEVKTIIGAASNRFQLVQDIEKQTVKTLKQEYPYKTVNGSMYLPYGFFEEVLNYHLHYEDGVLTIDMDQAPKGMDASQWVEYRIVNHLPEYEKTSKVTYTFYQEGVASWYGSYFEGRRTSSGEAYTVHALTAAHRELPFGTIIRVTGTWNGASVEVKVNDRGPYHGNRILDLSQAAAKAIGLESKGIGTVKIEIVETK